MRYTALVPGLFAILAVQNDHAAPKVKIPTNLSDCLNADEIANLYKCTGTADNPTAPPGVVCVYPTNFVGLRNVRSKGKGGYGFAVSWVTVNTNESSNACAALEAVWAYSAP